MAWTRLGLAIGGAPYTSLLRRAGSGFLDGLAEIAVAAEQAGFDCLWLPPAPPLPPASPPAPLPAPDPYVVAAALSPRTSSIWLGCLTTPLASRAPAVLAKWVTGLDVISGARAMLGFDAGGAPSGALTEALEIFTAILHLDAPSFSGTYFRIHRAWNEPRLRRPSGPPIVAAFSSRESVGETSLRAAARFADACALPSDPSRLPAWIGTVRAEVEASGRGSGELDVIGVVGPGAETALEALLESVALCFAAGCDGVVIELPEPFATTEGVAGLGAELTTVAPAHRRDRPTG